MESVFYKYNPQKRFQITYQFIELFAKSVENSGEKALAHELVTPVLSFLGHKPPYKEAFIVEVLEQLAEVQKAKEKTASKPPPLKRSFGTDFVTWFAKLDVDQILLLLSDFDYDKAFSLYSKVPVQVIDKMMETKMGFEWSKAAKDFEAVVFGMGGSIKGESENDMTNEPPKTEADELNRARKLKGMGF